MIVVGIFFFVLSLGSLVLSIVGFSSVMGSGFTFTYYIFFIAGFIAFMLFGFIANCIFQNQKYAKGKKGAVTVFYYLTIIQSVFFNYIILLIVSIATGIITIMIELFTGKAPEKSVKSGSEKKRDVANFMQNRVSSVAPTSQERYEFERKEAFSHFCAEYGYGGNDRKLALEFSKQG